MLKTIIFTVTTLGLLATGSLAGIGTGYNCKVVGLKQTCCKKTKDLFGNPTTKCLIRDLAGNTKSPEKSTKAPERETPDSPKDCPSDNDDNDNDNNDDHGKAGK